MKEAPGSNRSEGCGMTSTVPHAPSVHFDAIPNDLMRLDHWVLWRYTFVDGRDEYTKPPFQTSGYNANTTDSSTWATFEDARAAYEGSLEGENPYSGVGFVLTPETGIVGIDLDGCNHSGVLREWAKEVRRLLPATYTEVSPSGTGLRIFIRGSIPEGARNRVSLEGHVDSVPGDKRADFEWYETGRYLTLTGMRFENAPRVIAEVSPEALAEVWTYIATLAGKQTEKEKQASPSNDLSPVALSDDELLSKARNAKDGARFTALYDDADVSQHGDDYSAATMALLCLLAFWTRKDAERMDRLFRGSALMRDKWDSPRGDSTWGALDIQKACEFQTEVYTPPSKNEAGEEKTNKRQAATSARLLKLVEASGAVLCHDAAGACYICIRKGGAQQTYLIDSKQAKDHLSHLFWKGEKRGVSSQALEEALSVLRAKARWEGEERTIAVRIAEEDTDAGPVVYIDLGDESGDVVAIRRGSWGTLRAGACPVLFVRRSGSKPLPRPVKGSTNAIAKFADLLRLQPDEPGFLLIVFFCLQAFRGRGDYPILQIEGEQGSGKSTACAFIRDLIDPNTAGLRTIPASDRDAYIAGSNAHVLAFDNVSGITRATSDRFCRMATGASLATRTLHTDTEETLLNVCSPIIVNGINGVAENADLAERCLTVRFRHVSEQDRKYKSEMYAVFEELHPYLLGAFLDGVAGGLEALPHTTLLRRPRLADFARFCVASEEALGLEKGAFFRAFDGSRRELIAATIEGDQVAELIVDLVQDGPFDGTASELKDRLERQVGYGFGPGERRPPRSWPKTPASFKKRLNRLAPSLRESGVSIEDSRDPDRNRTRIIHLEKSELPSYSSEPSEVEEKRQGEAGNTVSASDGRADGRRLADGRPNSSDGSQNAQPSEGIGLNGRKKGGSDGSDDSDGLQATLIVSDEPEPTGDDAAISVEDFESEVDSYSPDGAGW